MTILRSVPRAAGAFGLAALAALATLAAAPRSAGAQQLAAPEASPAARVAQTVGLTEIEVRYHRPAVAGRAIWGALVPYGEVWRAGANENTTITFSTDVKIAGKPLRAGTYGLHAIPSARDWIVIFSNASKSWGSYSYDAKEDALRVVAKPRPLPAPEERLAYRFDDPTDTSVTLVLAWEKLAVPVAITVDTPKVVMASMRTELRGSAGFAPGPWVQAAGYWAHHGGPLDEALRLIDRAISFGPSYASLMTRAEILDKQNKRAAATDARAKAQALATEPELNVAAYRLLAAKKVDEAIAMFRGIVQRFPQSWNAQDSLGEALARKGDKAGAIAAYEKAHAMTTDPAQKKRIAGELAKLKR